MHTFSIGGIWRDISLSTNPESDMAIFRSVSAELKRKGYNVKVYSEDEFLKNRITEKVVFNLCRRPDSIEKLKEIENGGGVVVNSGYAIERCRRDRVSTILTTQGLSYPDSMTARSFGDIEKIRAFLEEKQIERFWIKRADSFATRMGEIIQCSGLETLEDRLTSFFQRGIKRVSISRHIDGVGIKFYIVRGEGFFYFLPDPNSPDDFKGGLRQDKDVVKVLDVERLRGICESAGNAMGIDIYGGDAILSGNGEICIIDFNDWPSFSPCRETGAQKIAERIISKANGIQR